MDLRKWVLASDQPTINELRELTTHVPWPEHRTKRIMRLFVVGFEHGFKLTDDEGQPTECLRLMVSMMPGVELCRAQDLPPDEHQAFCGDLGPLGSVFDPRWFLRGLNSNGQKQSWWTSFLPGLQSKVLTWRDSEGKLHRKKTYVASCYPNWRLTDSVYEGLWLWNCEHREFTNAWWSRPAKCPDGYAVLDQVRSPGP